MEKVIKYGESIWYLEGRLEVLKKKKGYNV